MRKIYSLVLMTAMLFVGANAWAVTQVATTQQLETAWANAKSGDTIQLTDNVDMDKTLWLGTTDMNGTPRSLTLDLNGHKLINDGTRQKLFFISHGELNVITSVAGGEIQHGTISADNYSSSYVIFLLAGSTYKTLNPKTATSGYYTHLTIGAGVTLTAKAVAVAIDAIGLMTWPISSTTTVGATGVTIPSTMPASLNTKIYPTKGRGVANGVRVDVHGYIRASKYAFKANGYLGAPSDKRADDPSPLTGFVVDPANTGLSYVIADADTAYTPFIRLYSTADMWVQADNNSQPKDSDKPVAVYCSGYSRWLIEGTCVGSTGVYVKSGDVDIHDATIQSTYTGTYTPPTGTGSGTQGQGSAIVIESNTAYAGDIDVNIGGDTKVTATNGYAIDEKVTTSDTTKVDAIVITGGSFEGGVVGGTPENPTYGTIAISETTAEAKDGQATGKTETTTIVVSGGSVEGNVSYGNEGDINNIVDNTQSYTTTVTDPETGKQTVVISQGEEPTAVASDFNVDTVAHKIDVKMDDAVTTKNQEITGTNKTVTLGTLTMNPATTPVTLTVKPTNTLIVDKIIMGYKAQIIVEAGAKLLVMGEQGITAPAPNNIVLKASETSQATFLFNPAVNSNRQPNATVELYTTSYQINASNHTWQRFSSPLANVDSMRNSFLAEGGELSPASPYTTSLRTWINYWDYSELKWKQILSTDMEPFVGYKITNNSKEGGVKYRFYGNLQGSVTSNLQFVDNGFNYFGNTYTAPMHIKTLLEQLAGTNIDENVNLWNTTYQRFDAITAFDITENMATKKAIPAMETFIFRLMSGGAGAAADVNYNETVWGYNTAADPENYNLTAPARLSDMNRVRIYIESANGDRDYVTLRQSDRFSADYESGADAVKLMQDGVMNFYVNADEENLSSIATDDMIGTILSLNTADEIQYTLSFAYVCGEPMFIKDMITGQIIEMAEGNTYNFVAQANEENVGRFQIVSRQEMPTAVETVEETIAPKAIYTIMGQYVGETTDWNNLPAGVYVVDGVKVIK